MIEDDTSNGCAVIEKICSDVYQISSAEGGSLLQACSVRIYEKQKAGMEWHVDDIIYQNTKQIEVVRADIKEYIGQLYYVETA